MDDDAAKVEIASTTESPRPRRVASSVLFVKRRDGNYRQEAVFEFYSLSVRSTMLYTA